MTTLTLQHRERLRLLQILATATVKGPQQVTMWGKAWDLIRPHGELADRIEYGETLTGFHATTKPGVLEEEGQIQFSSKADEQLFLSVLTQCTFDNPFSDRALVEKIHTQIRG